MPNQVTKVIYDVKDAIKNLDRLNEKIDESEKKAKSGFGEAGEASKKFEGLLGRIPGTAGKVASSIGRLGSKFGAVGLFAAGAAAAVGGLVANFINLPELLRDSSKTMDKFREATQRVLDTRNALADIEDAAAKAESNRTVNSIKIRNADATFRETEVRKRILQIKDEADAVKEGFRQQTDAFKEAASIRESLEKRLASRQADRTGGGAANADIQASNILDRAAEAARRGQVDLAEELVDKAKALQPELENQSFFAGQLEDTEEVIDRSLRDQISKARELEETAKSRAGQVATTLDGYEKQLDVLNKQKKVLSIIKAQLGGELKVAQEEGRRGVAARGRDEAVRGIEKVAADLRQEIADGGRSAAENIKDSISQSSKAFFGNAGIGAAAQQTIIKGLEPLADFATISKNLEAGTATFGDLKRFLDQNALKVSEAVGTLETATTRRGVSDAFKRDVDQLSRINDSILDLSKFLEQAVANDAAFSQQVRQGQGSAFDEFNQQKVTGSEIDEKLQALTSTAQDASGALERLQQGAKSFTDSLAGQGGGTPVASPTPIPAAGTAPINANFNVSVKGGLIDREVTESILDIVRREVRKLTSEGI